MDQRRKKKGQNSSDRKPTNETFRADSEIPSKPSIVSEEVFISPKKRRYLIIETDQADPYDDARQNKRKRRER
jgi:hypothetical protein